MILTLNATELHGEVSERDANGESDLEDSGEDIGGEEGGDAGH